MSGEVRATQVSVEVDVAEPYQLKATQVGVEVDVAEPYQFKATQVGVEVDISVYRPRVTAVAAEVDLKRLVVERRVTSLALEADLYLPYGNPGIIWSASDVTGSASVHWDTGPLRIDAAFQTSDGIHLSYSLAGALSPA